MSEAKEKTCKFFNAFKKVLKDKRHRWIWIFVALSICFILGAFLNGGPFESMWIKNLPKSEIIYRGVLYDFSYDVRTKNPSWVLEVLKKENIPTVIQNIEYASDPNIPEKFRIKTSDYDNTGFEIASLLLTPQLKALHLTYPLSASSPQHPVLARGYWTKFDDYVKSLPSSLDVDKVLVVTQPLYLPREESKQVTYKLIGKNDIAVPTHFFRAVFYPKDGKNLEWQTTGGSFISVGPIPSQIALNRMNIKGEIYLIPNIGIDEKTPLETFRIKNWDEINKIPGIVFPKDIAFYFTD